MEGVDDFCVPRGTGGAGRERLGIGSLEEVEKAHAPIAP
jgi:hypothetical protein